MASRATVNTDADLIQYQRDLVRTQQCNPLGRALKIAIGPSDNWRPADPDVYVRKYGRLLELRGQPLPIAEKAGLLLVTAPLITRDNRVGLPDVPEPDWNPPEWTPEEVTGKVARDPQKNKAPLITQRLTDRCEMMNGQPAVMQGTDFLIFQPVVSVTFQPELNKELLPDVRLLRFRNDVNGRCCAFLVDHKTGEAFFFGGVFEDVGASGG
jgi:hypothetical protein